MPSVGERKLVADLYDAALGHRAWGEAGPQLVRFLDGHTLMLSVHNPLGQAVDLVSTLGMTTEDLRQYSEHYARHDLWALGAVEKRLFERPVTGAEAVDYRVLERSLIYNEYLRPKLDMHYLLGALLTLDSGHSVVLGIHRPRNAADYTPDDVRRLGRILPHLRRALEVRQRLKRETQAGRATLAVLDRLKLGVLLLAPTGALVHANAAADAVLRADDGLTHARGSLRAGKADDDRRLQALIAGAAGLGPDSTTPPSGGHLRISRPSGYPAYAVMVAPMGTDSDIAVAGQPAVLVFIADPQARPDTDPAALMALFDLTPAEARLVLALANGVTLPAFASQAGLSYNTVRTLLARAMARTQTSSQLELSRRVLSSIANVPGARMGGPSS